MLLLGETCLLKTHGVLSKLGSSSVASLEEAAHTTFDSLNALAVINWRGMNCLKGSSSGGGWPYYVLEI